MISATIKINHTPILYITGTNEGDIDDTDVCTYDFDVYEYKTRKSTTGRVWHKRSHGAAELVRHILDEYIEQTTLRETNTDKDRVSERSVTKTLEETERVGRRDGEEGDKKKDTISPEEARPAGRASGSRVSPSRTEGDMQID